MKILFIPSWYPSKNNPIWGNYFIKQAENMSEYADVSMIHVERIGFKNIFSFFNNKKEKYCFKFYKSNIINLKRINLDLSYSMYKKAAYRLYKKYVKDNGKPDVIFAQSVLPAGLAAQYISEKENIPFVVHEHSIDVMKNYKKHATFVMKRANAYYAVSKKIKNYLDKHGRKDTVIIPNYIDTKKFDMKKKKTSIFTLISICNFFKVKSLETLFIALRIVIDKYNINKIKLNIIGTGEYEQYYKDICSNLDLNKYVNFKGYIDNKKIPNELCNSDVLCISSKIETFGIPIIEAFACGIPCISTKCGGPEEIINDSNGLLVAVDDYEAFAKAIVYMYTNSEKYNPKELKKYAYDNYDKKVVCKKLLSELKKVVKESGNK